MDIDGKLVPGEVEYPADVQLCANAFNSIGNCHCVVDFTTSGSDKTLEFLFTNLGEMYTYGANPSGTDGAYYHVAITSMGATWVRRDCYHDPIFLVEHFRGLDIDLAREVSLFMMAFEHAIEEIRVPD